MTVKYFNVKNGLSAGNITLDANSGNTTTTNLAVTGKSNLNNIANITITGGAAGYVVRTDGTGNLSFVNPVDTQSPAPMPTSIALGTTLIISQGYQGLFGYPITIDGDLLIEGVLVDVNDATTPMGVNGSVQYNNFGYIGGDSTFTYSAATSTVTASYFKTIPTTVNSLPSASAVGAGTRGYVTDSNTTNFLATVTGGGSNAVPVVSNGTNWVVG